jgi:hypothetical protein
MKRTITLITCIALGSLLVVLLASCAGPKGLGPTPPDVNTFHSKTTHELLKIERAYEKILISIGRAEAQGLISTERVQQIRGVADKVYEAIEQTKQSLSTFIATGGSRDLVTSSMATLIELMADLLSSHTEAGAIANLNRFRAMGGYPVAHCPNF